MKYDYLENIKADVLDYIKENYEKEDYEDLDYNELYDEMWIADSVTGNASGSYYCNTWKAEEALCHNMDLLADALDEFGYGLPAKYGENHNEHTTYGAIAEKGAEWCDVTVRCYLLGQALQEVLDELRGEEY